MSSPSHTEVSRTARSLAAAMAGDPFYRTVTVACGDDEAARRLDALRREEAPEGRVAAQ